MRRRYLEDWDDRQLGLDPGHKKLGGVCAGIARYLDVPSVWIRLAAVGGLFVHPPATLLAYGIAYMVLDPEY